MNFFLQLGKKVDILQDVQAYNHRLRVNSMVRPRLGAPEEFSLSFFFFFNTGLYTHTKRIIRNNCSITH